MSSVYYDGDPSKSRNLAVRYRLFKHFLDSQTPRRTRQRVFNLSDADLASLQAKDEEDLAREAALAKSRARAPEPKHLPASRVTQMQDQLDVSRSASSLREQGEEGKHDEPESTLTTESRPERLLRVAKDIELVSRFKRAVRTGTVTRMYPGIKTDKDVADVQWLLETVSSQDGMKRWLNSMQRRVNRGQDVDGGRLALMILSTDTSFAFMRSPKPSKPDTPLHPQTKKLMERRQAKIANEQAKRAEIANEQAKRAETARREQAKRAETARREQEDKRKAAEDAENARLAADEEDERRRRYSAALDRYENEVMALRKRAQAFIADLTNRSKGVGDPYALENNLRMSIQQGDDKAVVMDRAIALDRSTRMAGVAASARTLLASDLAAWERDQLTVPVTTDRNNDGEYLGFTRGRKINTRLIERLQYAIDSMDIAMYEDAFDILPRNRYRNYVEGITGRPKFLTDAGIEARDRAEAAAAAKESGLQNARKALGDAEVTRDLAKELLQSARATLTRRMNDNQSSMLIRRAHTDLEEAQNDFVRADEMTRVAQQDLERAREAEDNNRRHILALIASMSAKAMVFARWF